jgi:hypothetical protein
MTKQEQAVKVKIGSTEVILSCAVAGELSINGMRLFLLQGHFKDVHEYRRNILAFDMDGKFLWRISPSPYLDPVDKNIPSQWNALYQQDGRVMTICSANERTELVVDVKTGKVFFLDGTELPIEPDRNWDKF